MRKGLIAVAAVLAAAAAVWGLRRTVLAPSPVPVRVVAVAYGTVEETVSNSRAGTVKARRRAELSPEVGGVVEALPHREGERVAAGEVVMRLRSGLQSAELAHAESQLLAARAQRAQACLSAARAARERDRQTYLEKVGAISPDALDQSATAARTAAASCRAAGAAVDEAAASIELASRQLHQTVLRAPFDGIIAHITTEVGEFTTPSPPGLPIPPVIDFIDPASVYVSAPMDEADSARIHPGQRARLTLDAFRGQVLSGRVTRIATYVSDREEQNRTLEIEIDPALPPGVQPLPGSSADAEVIVKSRAHVPRVPTAAVLAGDQLLCASGGRAVARRVQIGIRNWDWCEVLSGVAAGDQVIVSLDRPEVKAGARVRVVAGGAAAGGGSAPP